MNIPGLLGKILIGTLILWGGFDLEAAQAEVSTDLAETGVLEARALLAGCLGCHMHTLEVSGLPAAEQFSVLGGSALGGEATTTLLQKYRSGELAGTVMNRIARGLTDIEIAQLGRAVDVLENVQ